MATKSNGGKWIEELINSVGEYIRLETSDGIQREGRISGFAMRHILFNEVDVDIPIEIELNGDPNDKVPLERINKINIG
jgi:hypothetical protein